MLTATWSEPASRPSGSSQEAEFAGCDAIVMGADPDRNRVVGDFVWSQEPQRVRRKAKKIPVFLVLEDPPSS